MIDSKIVHSQEMEYYVPARKAFSFILVAIVFVLFLLSLHYGGWSSGDFIIHMTTIRKLVELPKIEFHHYCLKGLSYPTYGHNIWYLILSMGTKITQIDAIKYWSLSAVFLVLIKALSFFSLARILFRKEKIAYCCLLVFMFGDGIMNYNLLNGKELFFWSLSEFAVPSVPARDIIMSVVLIFVFKFLIRGNQRYLVILPVLGMTIALVHFYYVFMLIFLLGAFLVFSFFWKTELKSLTKKLFLVIIFISFPAVIYSLDYKRNLDTPLVNKWYASSELVHSGYKPVIYIKDKFPLIDPFKGLWQNPVRKVAFLLVPFLLLYFRKESWAMLYSAISLTILFIFINPFLLYFAQKLQPALDRIYRLVEIVPFYSILGFFLYKVLSYRKIRLIAIVLTAVGIIWLIPSRVRNLSKISSTTVNTFKMVDNNAGFIKTVKQLIPPGSVVLMEPKHVWGWIIFFPYYPVVAAWGVHLPPNYDQTPRMEGQKKFLESPLISDSFSFLEKYDVDYLLIDDEFPVKKDIENHPKKFQSIFSATQFTLYKYRR